MKTEEIGKILLESMYKAWEPKFMIPHRDIPSIEESHPEIDSERISTVLKYLKSYGYIDFKEIVGGNGLCMTLDFQLTADGVDFIENERPSLRPLPSSSTVINNHHNQYVQGNGNTVSQINNNVDERILELMNKLISEHTENREELESVKTVLVEASKKGKIGPLEKAMVKLCEFTFNHIVGPAAESGIALLITQLLSST